MSKTSHQGLLFDRLISLPKSVHICWIYQEPNLCFSVLGRPHHQPIADFGCVQVLALAICFRSQHFAAHFYPETNDGMVRFLIRSAGFLDIICHIPKSLSWRSSRSESHPMHSTSSPLVLFKWRSLFLIQSLLRYVQESINVKLRCQ